MPSATHSALAMPVGQNAVSTASTFGSAATIFAAPPKRSPSASPITSTGLACDQCFGRIALSFSIVSGASVASCTFSELHASAASTPGPPPLVTMASRSPRGLRRDDSARAAAKRSWALCTRTTPQRARTASNTASLPTRAPVCERAACEPEA